MPTYDSFLDNKKIKGRVLLKLKRGGFLLKQKKGGSIETPCMIVFLITKNDDSFLDNKKIPTLRLFHLTTFSSYFF